jgi:amidase
MRGGISMKVITADNLISYYDERLTPCAEIQLNERVCIETHDRIPLISNTEHVADFFHDHFHPIYSVTGPIYIDRVQPDDILKIEILDVVLTSCKGIICATPGRAGFGDKIKKAQSKIVDIIGSEILFSEDIRIPINPHIGKIATTPSGDRVPTGIPGPYGGNMDNKYLSTGSTIYLPVFVEGGLLSLGDLHAAMGDGESNSSGVEATGRVTLRCNLEKSFKIKNPLVVTQNEVQMLGHGKTLEEATRLALDLMAQFASEELKIDYLEAAMLISIAGDLHICQISNPLVGVRVSLSKKLFSFSGIFMSSSEKVSSPKPD